MGDEGGVRTPTVLWAQRKDRLFLTIEVVDAEAPQARAYYTRPLFSSTLDVFVSDRLTPHSVLHKKCVTLSRKVEECAAPGQR